MISTIRMIDKKGKKRSVALFPVLEYGSIADNGKLPEFRPFRGSRRRSLVRFSKTVTNARDVSRASVLQRTVICV